MAITIFKKDMTNKKQSNSLVNVLIIIGVISLVLIFFIGSFISLFLNKENYISLYEKTGTFQRIDKDTALNKTSEIFNFFMEKENLSKDFFTSNEISHMNDVRDIIKKTVTLYFISIFSLVASLIIIYFFYREKLSYFANNTLFFSGIITLIIISLFFISSFTTLFENFHKIFFVDNYSFPKDSNLIKLFSEEFFYLFATKIFTHTLIKALISSTAGAYLLFIKKSSKIIGKK